MEIINMSNNNALGQKVKQIRIRKNWKQDTLADKAELTQGEISKIENGNIKIVKEDTILKLAKAFEIEPIALARGTIFEPLFNASPLAISYKEDQPLIMGYFASALTELNDEQLAEIEALDQCVDDICRKKYTTYPVIPYRPRLYTSPKDNADKTPQEVYEIDQEKVATSDLLFLATLYTSFGAGMELQLALQSCSSVLFLIKKDKNKKISRMVLGCPVRHEIVEYEDLDDLENKLVSAMNRILPVIAEHRFAEIQVDDVSNNLELAERIQLLREQRKLSEEDLAELVGVDVAYIHSLESKSDRIINPSLEILRRTAKALWTSVAYLVSGQQGMDERFAEHYDELESFAIKADISHENFKLLWTEHFETYKNDFSILDAKNRANIGSYEYWGEKYEQFKEQETRGRGLY